MIKQVEDRLKELKPIGNVKIETNKSLIDASFSPSVRIIHEITYKGIDEPFCIRLICDELAGKLLIDFEKTKYYSLAKTNEEIVDILYNIKIPDVKRKYVSTVTGINMALDNYIYIANDFMLQLDKVNDKIQELKNVN